MTTTQQQTEEQPTLRVRDVAEINNVSPQTVYHWIHQGKIRVYRTNGGKGAPRFKRSDVEPKPAEDQGNG